MDKSKIKNFIILLLTLVNLFLLYIVVSGALEQRKADNLRLQALTAVLTENGITLNSDIKLPESIPSTLSLTRDTDAEQSNLSALIGNCTVIDQGGNIYFYSGSDGQAKIRGTGEFEILLDAGVIELGKDPVSAAKYALEKLNIEYGDIEPIVEQDGDNTKVTLCCSLDGTAIYNANITFIFTSDYLILISGTKPLDTKYSVQSSENYPDSVTVLMNFLESVRNTGYVCSEINDLKIEYNMYSAVSGLCTLKPVWCVSTNSGLYYIDAQTGKAENLEAAP